MNNFFILDEARETGFDAFVLANGVHSPLEQRGDLEEELRRAGIRGAILFDLLLSQGTKSRRYFIANFDGEHLSPLKSADEVPPRVAEESARALRKHVNKLDFSLVGRAMAFAVKQGYSF